MWLSLIVIVSCTMNHTDWQERDRLQGLVAEQEARVQELEDKVHALETRLAVLEQAGTVAPAPTGSVAEAEEEPARLEARCVLHGDSYLLEDPSVLARIPSRGGSARIIPYDRSGVRGVQLAGIRYDSLLATCGFRNGDVLLDVSGHALTGREQALEAWQALQGAEEITVNLVRGGEPASLRIVFSR